MNLTKPLVRSILEKAQYYDWTLQGFGMLRMYLEPELRLHIWDSKYKFPNVSMMHDHPWNFESLIIAGELYNHRFEYTAPQEKDSRVLMRQTILCGENGGLCGGPEQVDLIALPREFYCEGDTYSELANEIHISRPIDGTITIIKREFLEDSDHAHVFWAPEKEWITAEPRPATIEEIQDITARSLERWF